MPALWVKYKQAGSDDDVYDGPYHPSVVYREADRIRDLDGVSEVRVLDASRVPAEQGGVQEEFLKLKQAKADDDKQD